MGSAGPTSMWQDRSRIVRIISMLTRIPLLIVKNRLSGGREAERWFYFDEDGYAESGWHKDEDGHWYYLNPVPEGTTWHYDEEAEKWYYDIDTEHRPYGSMYRNERTPDGYLVKEDGRWDGEARME